MQVQDWLDRTTAADIMVREVKTLRPEDPLAEAARLFLSEGLSGAPVVDSSGKCVGLLSVSDLPRAEEEATRETEKLVESSLFHSSLTLPASVYEERLVEVRDQLVPVSEQPIERYMRRDLISVREETALRSVVEEFVRSHVHRLLVLEGFQLRGIVSTLDVLRASLEA